MHRWALCLVCLAAGLTVSAAVTADRFGALYYPGETAAFETDQAGVWRVHDWRNAEVATGEVESGKIAVSHESLGKRFGTFKLTVGTNETWFAFLRSAKVKPCGWVGTGTHCSYGWYQMDYRYLDLIAAAGIGVVRDDVIWNWYEHEKGVYVFDVRLRGLIDELNKRGIRFHPVLNGKNALYGNPLDPDAYAKFAVAFVEEFKGKVTSCDILNEPHNSDFARVYLPEGGEFTEWQCRPDAPWIPKHRTLTRKAVVAIKAVDQSFSPGVGVEDFWIFFRNSMLASKGAPSGLVTADDLVSIHTYGTKTEVRPEKNYLFVDGGQDVRDTLRQNGGATRLVITEAGWPTYSGSSGIVKACSLVEQAQYLVRFYILARHFGVEFACQYDFRNDGADRTNQEHNFGIMREDCTPKPSFTALATMTRLVGEAELLGSLSRDEPKYRLYAFRKGSRTVVAAWSVTGKCAAAVPTGLKMDKARCIDLQGNETAVPFKDRKLQLTEIPVYLVF